MRLAQSYLPIGVDFNSADGDDSDDDDDIEVDDGNIRSTFPRQTAPTPGRAKSVGNLASSHASDDGGMRRSNLSL